MDEGKVFKRKPSKCPGWSASVHSPLHAAHAADGAVLEEAGTEVDWQQEVSADMKTTFPHHIIPPFQGQEQCAPEAARIPVPANNVSRH